MVSTTAFKETVPPSLLIYLFEEKGFVQHLHGNPEAEARLHVIVAKVGKGLNGRR